MTGSVFPFMPGVPSAGHVARGYFHSGRADNCTKCGTDEWSQRSAARAAAARAAGQNEQNTHPTDRNGDNTRRSAPR